MHYYDDMRRERSIAIRLTPAVKWLLIVNVGVFVLLWFLGLLDAGRHVTRALALSPGDLKHLFIWQLVTYAFLHGDFWHILVNMICLFFFGRDIEARLGTRRFLFFYLTAAAFAGLIFSVWHMAGADLRPVVGASGAVMGIMVMFAVFWPRRKILWFVFPLPIWIPLPAWLLVSMFVLGDLLATLQASDNGVANVCHLGGALYGAVFPYLCPRLERWLSNREKEHERRTFRSELQERQELDRILDKVHAQGMQSLNRRERRFLKEVSQKLGKR